MKASEYLPMFLGELELTVRNGRKQVISRVRRSNTIQSGILSGVPYHLSIDNSTSAHLACIGIDYAESSVNGWLQGTVPTVSAIPTWDSSKVAHTNSYTPATTKTIKRLRMRRRPTAFSANDLPDLSAQLSEITGLNITLQTNWTLETSWTVRTV